MESLLKKNGCDIVISNLSTENGGTIDLIAECPCEPQGEFGRRKVSGKCSVSVKVHFVPDKKE
ncbi:conserved hypothetical protein [Lausannevirus]|uniref:Uncharacterized protein n=1 Tax=Lausannevirus TaxID=999883 RepID=F2WKY0_9VIRU|nr:hypothetical protein LAU_0047 [Lausannevirus]AEA06903.1 conserved hypothetical protein [Lausannevirus]